MFSARKWPCLIDRTRILFQKRARDTQKLVLRMTHASGELCGLDSRFFLDEVCRIVSPNNSSPCPGFEQALQISREQGAKSLELRAAMSMTRLSKQLNKLPDDRFLLERIYNEFTEGQNTVELKEAAKLMCIPT